MLYIAQGEKLLYKRITNYMFVLYGGKKGRRSYLNYFEYLLKL